VPEVSALHPALAPAVALALLAAGTALTFALDALLGAAVAGRPLAAAARAPWTKAAFAWRRAVATTERPDGLLWIVAPAAYAALAGAALCVVPLGEGLFLADVRTGIVFFGAAEALAIVAIFLHGWAPNSYLPLMGAYRFVGLGLSYELLSMFVLIATALPAESLQVSAIVRSQAGLWNVVRQPLGLPLWLVVASGVTFWGPLNVADGRDLAGGTSAEVSGRARLLWQAARGAMLAVFGAMGAAAFLGGWHGPLLPGWAWMILKTALVIALVVLLGHGLGRIRAERLVPLVWTVLLPLSFVGLLGAGLWSLWS
jgi:NADH-quinone oxidoreductase subunit H